MATGARGEGLIETKERTYPVLLTNRALAEVEKNLGKPAMAIARSAGDVQLSISDTAELLRAGLEYGRREEKWSKDAVRLPLAFDIMEEVGWSEAAKVVMECLGAVLTYERPGEDAEDDSRPPA